MDEKLSLKIYLATDHAGFQLKQAAKVWLLLEGYEVIDLGATSYDETDDYPAFIAAAARAVSLQPQTTRAVIFGGSGQGEAMLANRFPQVRATVYYGGPLDIVTVGRAHNDANILSVGARFVTHEEAKAAILAWLEASASSDPKYARRIAQAEKLSPRSL